MTDLHARFLTSVRDVAAAEWDALRSPKSSPFVSWTWLDCLEQSGCLDGNASTWLSHHIAVFRGSDLIAVAPAYVKTSSEGEFVFDWSWAEVADRLSIPYYPKLVVAVPFTPATGDRVLIREGEDRAEMIARVAHAAVDWAKHAGVHGIHVLFPREDEMRAWEGAGFLRRAGYQFHWHSQGETAFSDFLQRFNSKRRHQIRREISEIEKRGIQIETIAGDAMTPDITARMFAFYKDTALRHYYGAQYLNRAFFDCIVERFRDHLAWVIAKDASEIIAGAFNVRSDDTLYGRYWGACADVPFLHFNVCYYEGVRYAIDRGLGAFEPGAGGEHKRARGFLPTMTHSAHWVESGQLTRILQPHLERERQLVADIVQDSRD